MLKVQNCIASSVPKEHLEIRIRINKNMSKLRRDSEKWVESSSNWDKGLSVTIHLPEYLKYGNGERILDAIHKRITWLKERIEKRVFKDKNKQVEIFPVIERGEGNHIHILTNTPEHIQRKHYAKDIERSVNQTNGLSLATDKYDEKKQEWKRGIETIYSTGIVGYVHKKVQNSYDNISAENIYFRDVN